MTTHFALAMATIRKECNEAQALWAERLGMKAPSYADVESGQRSPLTDEMIAKLNLSPERVTALRQARIQTAGSVTIPVDPLNLPMVAVASKLEAAFAEATPEALAQLLLVLQGQSTVRPGTIQIVHTHPKAPAPEDPGPKPAEKLPAKPEAPKTYPLGSVPPVPQNPGDDQVYNRRGPLVVHGIDWAKPPDAHCIERPMEPTPWSWAITRHNECTIHPDRIDDLLCPEMWDAHPWTGWRTGALRKLLARWCVLHDRRPDLATTDDPAYRLAGSDRPFDEVIARLWAMVQGFPVIEPSKPSEPDPAATAN